MTFTRQQKANAIRALSMDAVQRANSGHPGMPMGMADIAEVLWSEFLKHNPSDPDWVDRDRFVVSNGHGSMLLYALLHLSGYDLSIEDLKQFRQLKSRTPGHPEYGCTPGVETTTGPLGQGLANAVGMAIAERALGEEFNKVDCTIVDHFTYVFDRQPADYRESVLPKSATARVAVEAGATSGWRAYTGLGGDVIGLDSFGESAPAGNLYEHFGIIVDKIVEAVERVVVGENEELPMAASN